MFKYRSHQLNTNTCVNEATNVNLHLNSVNINESYEINSEQPIICEIWNTGVSQLYSNSGQHKSDVIEGS